MAFLDDEARANRARIINDRRRAEQAAEEEAIRHKAEAEQALAQQFLDDIRYAYSEGRDRGYFDFGPGSMDAIEARWPGVRAVIDTGVVIDAVRAAIHPYKLSQGKYGGGYNVIFSDI